MWHLTKIMWNLNKATYATSRNSSFITNIGPKKLGNQKRGLTFLQKLAKQYNTEESGIFPKEPLGATKIKIMGETFPIG